MNSLLRASLTAALVLPMTLPVSAAPASGPLSLSRIPSAFHSQGRSAGAADLFKQLHAKRHTKTTHFSFPYGLATDAAGNLYVTNVDNDSVAMVTSALKIVDNYLTQSLSVPVSVAVDSSNDVYVGSAGAGYITSYFRRERGQAASCCLPRAVPGALVGADCALWRMIFAALMSASAWWPHRPQ